MNMNHAFAADTDPDPERDREASAASAEAAEDAEMLKELAQIGMRLARLVEANAEARVAQDPACDLGRTDQMFARISRSIRQTLALKAKLTEMRQKRAAASLTEERQREAEAARRRWRKTRVERAVAETISAGRGDGENLLSDLHERLSDPDIEADLAAGSIGEMVAGVCDDLGIKPDRKIWKDKGWYLTENWHARLAKAEAAVPAPQEPYAVVAARYLAEINAMTDPLGHPLSPAVPVRPPDDG
jgi:ribosomal protein S21